MLRSDKCNYSGAYVAIIGTITVEEADDRNKHNRSLILENNAPFISCSSKINRNLIDNAKKLDAVMPIYNLTEYSQNYSQTSGTLWNYYKDILIDPIRNSESFKYMTSITGNS